MKRLVLALMVLSLLGLGGQSFAELCTIDDVPAATLLLPYFEVDLNNTNGVTTLFSINNASAAPALAHAIMWTDWSAPTIDFDIFLTGYDVVTVNVRDIFADGILPVTATDAVDGTDSISPHGNNPAWDGDFPNCQNFFPFPTPAIGGTAANRLTGHTGAPVSSLGGGCIGYDHGDGHARGYITIDSVSECSLAFTDTPGYFAAGGTGIANNENVLWGDYFFVDPANAFAQGDNLVHIEADPSMANLPTNYTFYGRYTQGIGLVDEREPLGTTWATRYLNGGAFSGGTTLQVWRDSTANDTGPWTCGVGPSWFPLNETEVVAFDEAEDAVELCFFTGGVISPPDEQDPACFPLETGRYDFGASPLNGPFDFGWAYLNLNLPPDAPVGDVDFPAGGGLLAQSHVTAIHDASGLYSVGYPAIELTSACEDLNIQLGPSWNIPQFGG